MLTEEKKNIQKIVHFFILFFDRPIYYNMTTVYLNIMEDQGKHWIMAEDRGRGRQKSVENAAERVDRMNHIFDKLILPIIGFTVAIFILFAVFGGAYESCSSAPAGMASSTPPTTAAVESQSFYAKRAIVMSRIESNRETLEAFGYEVSDQYGCGLTARWQYSPSTYSIDYFNDGKVYAIIRHDAGENAEAFDYIAMGIYTERMITVEIGAGEECCSVVFTDEAFASVSPGSDEAETDRVLALATREMLISLLEMYKANTNKLLTEIMV